MLCCSCSPVPAASPATGAGMIAAAPLSSRRKVHQLHNHVHPVAINDQNQLSTVVAAAVVVGAAAAGGDGGAIEESEPANKKKKAAWAARRRPSKLVIPAAADASCQALLEEELAAAAAAEEEEAEVEIEGDGFWISTRRGTRHATMEDGYGVITEHKIDGHSQLAFYGVYDGHGGRAAVDFVSGRLGNSIVSCAAPAARAERTQRSSSSASSPSPGPAPAVADDDHVAAAIRAAYRPPTASSLARGGACAATALVIGGDLYVANVGDCRAVISRDGAATALTSDHTAAREDERTRIESSGGYVSCGSNGVWRVQDSLAVSRAFGDGGLKRWVVAEPEVSKTRLAAGCEFLVIASDGLWNKVSNQEAVDAVAAGAGSDEHSVVVSCCRQLVDMHGAP
ncbi:hypothetical protein GUJ93_ZPchr0011g27892 [Zizania palustris]|uniref:protein-serine/threonine phosphatase n=1 Tax=Zizania palustris TaxID=103762 RepID=A0A8J6BQ37_ZIZPA|nr:hypothetical protein GUJ93_ZPchr0011g27892 [Zizania palustris]